MTFIAQFKMTGRGKSRSGINLMWLWFSVSNRDGVGALSYRMLDGPDQVVIAQVDDKGFLLSGSLTGISSLLITSQETFGVNQTLILAVKVSLRATALKVFHIIGCKGSVFWILAVKFISVTSGLQLSYNPDSIQIVFTDCGLTKCPWANLVKSWVQLCFRQRGELRPTHWCCCCCVCQTVLNLNGSNSKRPHS